MTPLTWNSASASDRGRVRQQNEDALLDVPGAGLFAVADGMGGHAAGEVASRLAVETLERDFAGRDPAPAAAPPSAPDAGDGGGGRPRSGDAGSPLADPVAGELDESVREANRRIVADARDNPARSGMGTTLTALLLGPGAGWRVGHVGDSRAYLLRDGSLRQVTRDHSWVGEQVARGRMTKEEARKHPMSSMLERALGTGPEVDVDLTAGALRAGDLFLLASDGLTDMVPDAALARLLEPAATGDEAGLENALEALVAEANAAGGRDNITAVLVRVSEAAA